MADTSLADAPSPVDQNAAAPSCRHCGAPLTTEVVDLGLSAIANDLVPADKLAHSETLYPLQVLVCDVCHLAQTRDFVVGSDVFTEDYVYFSSTSTSWLKHAETYVDHMVGRFGFGPDARFVEIASNDGYLLQYMKAHGVKTLGIEPCRSVAEAAIAKGIDTRVLFFGREAGRALAAEGWRADGMAANNVLAHVPDINDFVGGFQEVLAPEGVATFEIQHLMRLMQGRQFDTVYHEHFSYMTLIAGEKLFASQGLRIFDVEEVTTHGGSLRFFVCHADAAHSPTQRLADVRQAELDYGLDTPAAYGRFNEEVKATKRAFLKLLIELKDQGKTIAGYGAPAKATTLLNYVGVGTDMIDFIVDKAPSKQHRWVPGVRVPILPVEALYEAKPDYIILFVWNLKAEIMAQLADVKDWGAKFILPLPEAHIAE